MNPYCMYLELFDYLVSRHYLIINIISSSQPLPDTESVLVTTKGLYWGQPCDQ